jgi:plasmid stabilization system protein ParE
MKIEFSQKAYVSLEQIAEYIFEQSQFKKITRTYVKGLNLYITQTLSLFPQAGRPAEEFGKDVRKLVYQRYSILYKVESKRIVVLTLFRENLPAM